MILKMLYAWSAVYVLIGDYYCIQASKTANLWLLSVPSICWGLIGPATWYYIFKTDGLAKANILGSVSVALVSILIGVLMLKEPFTAKHIAGAALGIISVWLLS